MKKNITYLVIIFLMIFCGINRTYASDFSCRYKVGTPAAPVSVMLTYKESEKLFYLYEVRGKDVDFDSEEWVFSDSSNLSSLIKFGENDETPRKFRFANSYVNKDDVILEECPEKVYVNDLSIYVFNNGSIASGGENRDLIEQKNYFYSPVGNGETIDPNLNELGYGESCGSLNLENYWIVDPGSSASYLYAYNISFDIKSNGKTENKKLCFIVQVLENSSGSIETYSNFQAWEGTTKFESNVTEVGTEKLYGSYSCVPDNDLQPACLVVSSSPISASDDGKKFSFTLRHSTDGSVNIDDENLTCEALIGDDVINELNKYFNFFRILVPILLIVLGVVDFGSAVFSNSEDGMKKASSKFMKRVIISIIIFLIPTFINVLLNIANTVWGWNSSNCGIG